MRDHGHNCCWLLVAAGGGWSPPCTGCAACVASYLFWVETPADDLPHILLHAMPSSHRLLGRLDVLNELLNPVAQDVAAQHQGLLLFLIIHGVVASRTSEGACLRGTQTHLSICILGPPDERTQTTMYTKTFQPFNSTSKTAFSCMINGITVFFVCCQQLFCCH